MVARADAGQHQQLRRTDRAGADDHLFGGARGHFRAAVLAVDHAGGNVALEGQPMRQRVQFHHQPPFVAHRLQVGAGGAGAFAVVGGGLVETDAVLAVAVEVVAIGQVQLRPARINAMLSGWR